MNKFLREMRKHIRDAEMYHERLLKAHNPKEKKAIMGYLIDSCSKANRLWFEFLKNEKETHEGKK